MGYLDKFGITENEDLFSTITIPRMIQVIKNSNNEVTECERSTNNYGEFLFINIRSKKDNDTMFFYVFGYHELMNKYLIDKARTGFGNYDKDSKALNKVIVIRKILAERKKAVKDSKKYAKEKGDTRKPEEMEMEELEEINFI